MEKEPTVFVGVDWASVEHQVCRVGPDGPVQRAFAHDADGLNAMVDWLLASASVPQDVAVAIEVPPRARTSEPSRFARVCVSGDRRAQRPRLIL